ncbi:serine/threonine protein phosphatase [Paenibacillus rhizovicinus]|uniref:Serine/threonine protein phosphatase n=1 Tax=Paenibacillus rhizovicinus TaxID=2704463 RepID=A0A6C0P2L2_9BACL|nr:metallophosphoesterase family protein [Paenibacillus rhizovicinus]QHW32506.1 serine/threonine protein phosphatase [Paenibacillus rhizovicinus]
MVNSNLNLRPRLLAISDIHGCEDSLKKLLASANYDPARDRLMLLGDYIDAGNPGTYGTLDYIRTLVEQGAHALPGNHELKLLRRLEDAPPSGAEADQWRSWAGWIRSLPGYRLEDEYLFVHAGIRPGIGLDAQTLIDLTEIRDDFLNPPLGSEFTVVFGHTPTFRLGAQPGKLWFGDGKIGIDTGAKHGQRLTLLDVHARIGYWCATGPNAEKAGVNETFY